MFPAIFKAHRIICLALVSGICAYDFDDLNNLGQRITDRVNQQLAPLHNLGARINARVKADLEPIRSGHFGRSVNDNVNQHLSGLDNLGDRISADLSPLNNLGQQIEQSVYEGLEPVRALEIKVNMKDGVGGTTIATHLPEGKKFIIRNRQSFLCSGSIDENGACSGTLTPFKIASKQDYCYFRNNYSIVNNNICIGAISMSVINNVVTCESGTDTPALLTTVEEFNKLCKGHSETVEYKYIADPNDPNHVAIPNRNKHVKCSNNQAGVCIFTESHFWPNYSSGRTIVINNY